MSYTSGIVTVGTTPTVIATVGERGGIVVQNTGSAAVVLGGPNVAVSTGISLAAGATLFVPSVGTNPATLYGVVATATQPVAYLYPSD